MHTWLVRAFTVVLACGAFSCATSRVSGSKFQALYDHYFPRHSPYVTTDYRKWFDHTIFDPDARSRLSNQEKKLYDAVRGGPAAFHAFVHSEYRDSAGEFGETWNYECVLLLLVLGDEQFANLLAREDPKTKALVGDALGAQINWRKHPFPRTRNVSANRNGSNRGSQ